MHQGGFALYQGYIGAIFLSYQFIHERPLKLMSRNRPTPVARGLVTVEEIGVLKLASRNRPMPVPHRFVTVEGTTIRLNRKSWLLRTELECIELIIMSTYSQELCRGACFDDAALVKYQDQVGTLNGGEAMCAHQCRAPDH